MGLMDRHKRKKKAPKPSKKKDEPVTPRPQEVAAPEPEPIVKDAKKEEEKVPEPEAAPEDLSDQTLVGIGPAPEPEESSSPEPVAQDELAQVYSEPPSDIDLEEDDVELVSEVPPAPDSSEEPTVRLDISKAAQQGQAARLVQLMDEAPTGGLPQQDAEPEPAAEPGQEDAAVEPQPQEPQPRLSVVGGESRAPRRSRRQLPPPRPAQQEPAQSAEEEQDIMAKVAELLAPITQKLEELEGQVGRTVSDTVGKKTVDILTTGLTETRDDVEELKGDLEDVSTMVVDLVGKDGDRIEGQVTLNEEQVTQLAIEYLLSVTDQTFSEFATTAGGWGEQLSLDTFGELAEDESKIKEYLANRNYSVFRFSVSEIRRIIAENNSDVKMVVANTRATYKDLPDSIRQIVDEQAGPLREKAAELAEKGDRIAAAKNAFEYLYRETEPSLEEFAEEYETDVSEEPFEHLIQNQESVMDWVSKKLHKLTYVEINEEHFGDEADEKRGEVHEEVERIMQLASELVAGDS